MMHRPSFGSDAHLSTLVDLLRWRAQQQPVQRIYTFLVDGGTEELSLTYAELDRQARAIATQLRDMDAVGERALLLYPPGLDYIAALFGCLYAGVVAVPAYPPDPARLTRTLPRLNAIVQDAQPTLTLTTTPILALSEALTAHAPDLHTLRWLATDTLMPGTKAEWLEPELSGATLALLQYTSGSTAAPKGVMLTHSNLLHNSAQIARGFGHTPESRGVIWLPPYHDMGLIGGILQPLYANFPVALLSPLDFLQRPVSWLQAITHHRATTSGGPNFAYDLCVRKVTPEQRSSLDLSSWTVAFNGAEPVRNETLERFAATFASCGFRRAAFYPCYGLAEATLIVTGGAVTAPPTVHTFAGDALKQNRVIVASTEADGARTLVSVGRCLPDQQIAIVDSDCGQLCPPDRVGEIWVAGPGVALGYWNRSAETQQTFRAALRDTGAGPFLRTGDLGFVYDGELFLTGRLKDLIIIRGRNHYPQDIELTVERSHAALRPGCSAAFAVEVAGEERLVVVQEVARQARQLHIAEVLGAIRQAVAAAHEVPVYAVALLKPGSIPKTASGKIQRHACRMGFLAGALEEIGRSVLDEQATAADAPSGADTPELSDTMLRGLNADVRGAVLATYMRQQVARVLGVAPAHLDLQQPLSALGLDSLSAIELQHTLETQINIVVPMVDMLQGASVAQLADQARAAFAAALPPSSPLPVAEQASKAAHPLSHGQRALWFLHQLAPESRAYHIASAMRIHGPLNIPALRQAFQALIDHHPSLRTTFVVSDGEPAQQILPHTALDFAVEDARTWPTAALDTRLAAATYRPFDLACGPLLRVCLFQRAPQQHLLLLVIHHLVADLWSLALLVHELGQHYAATLAARTPPARPPAPPYAAFVHWQRDHVAGEAGAQLAAYWRGQLASMPTRLALPTDRPRPPIQTYRGAAHAMRLDKTVTERLRGLARGAGTTLYTALLAAFEVLLHRYSGQERLLVGAPASGRSRAEWAGIVGYFVNTIVLRSELRGNPPFTTLLAQTQATVLGALAHQDYPFALLVEELQRERDPSRAPLVQVVFALQKAQPRDGADLSAFALGEAGARLAVGPLMVESLALAQRTAHFDLSVQVAEMDGGLIASWQYNTDLFDAATIARMARQFRALLTSIDADSAWPVADLPLLTLEERHQLLVEWNASAAEYPRDQSLAAAFEAQVDHRPDAVALIFDAVMTNDERPTTNDQRPPTNGNDSSFIVQRSSFGTQQLTYRELNRRANQLAHYLRALGVGPEVLVGICMEAAPELLVGALGILKAGGAYVPLDPTHAPARLAFMLADSRAQVLLMNDERRTTNDALSNKVTRRQGDTENGDSDDVTLSPGHLVTGSRRTVDLRADWPAIARRPTTEPSSVATADSLAYVLYTSGSTGQPKGTLIAQRSVRSYVRWVGEQLLGDTVAHLPMVTRLSFDASLKQFFAPLLHGEPVWMLPSEVIQNPAALVKALRTRSRVGLNCIPALWEAILDVIESDRASAPAELIAGLFLGGDRFDTGLVARSLAALPHLRIWNLYGPTEATANASMALVPPGGHPTIGRPIANTQIYVLDARLQPLPIGVPGELYIGGIGLARGYLGRPDLTAARFIPNPFAEVSGARYRVSGAGPSDTQHPTPDTRLYKTGDLARWRPDGNLEFLGRIDQQVKVRGYRIELGEIESVLLQHPAVRETAVLARADIAGDKRLVAYVVPTADERRTTNDEGSDSSFVIRHSSFVSELKSFLAARLPAYMIPSAFVLLEALPLTTSGKLDRQALPEPGGMELEDVSLAARTPIEELVAGIWASVLGLERLGIDDNFFEWGGHSLLATQVIARVQESMAVELPVSALFEAPTVRGMAEEVERALRTGQHTLVPPLVQRERGSTVPLSFAQQRLWFLDQLEPGAVVYSIPLAVRLTGTLDIVALRRGLEEIVRRHAALRTTFAMLEGRPIQRIAPALKVPLPLVDLRALLDGATAARQLAAAKVHEPFDLAGGPLLRTTLLRLGDQEHMFVLTTHHIVADGWSLGVFVQELAALYDAFSLGKPSPLSDLAIQYADYAVWQRQWLRGKILKAQMGYWRSQLNGSAFTLDLPLDRPRPAVQTFRGAHLRVALSKRLSRELKVLSQREGTTLFMALLAAFATLLYRYTAQNDILIGSPIANRNRADLEPLIGCFINMLVLRGDLAGNPSFQELLGRVREVALGAYVHQDMPFELLVDELGAERDLSRNPLFQVMFALHNMPLPILHLTGLVSSLMRITHQIAQFDLSLNLWETQEYLNGRFEYNTDLFDATTITRMAAHFTALLESIAADPTRRLADLALLTEPERQQLLIEWNDTAEVRSQKSGGGCRGEACLAPTWLVNTDDCIHHQFEARVDQAPDAVALVFEDQHLTCRALNRRANQLGHRLQRLGVQSGQLVGICIERSAEMIVGLLGILKAGGAYVPLDPAYPPDRIGFMLQDSGVPVLLLATQDAFDKVTRRQGDKEIDVASALTLSPLHLVTLSGRTVIDLVADWPAIARLPDSAPASGVRADHLAYVIYTSGSTGRPKGVMVSHRNVVNCFSGMDGCIGCEPPGVWLALTSISFDISVLELLWSLTRGFKVIVQGEDDTLFRPARPRVEHIDSKIDFSLFYFASDDHEAAGDKYKLLLDGARFADQHGFAAVWTPERHFHAFGGLYPNPAVTSAAIAALTERIQIRAGSVVLPLHNPVRVAEEWALVDNLSKGRVGLSFASGWHADDFVLMPDQYANRKEVMLRAIETVQRLWRGASVSLPNGAGKEMQIRIYPQPIQPELPIWLTAAGNPETFRIAGQLGANLLTHLLGQSVEELAEKIKVYRDSRRKHGHDMGHVTLMLHTFVGDDREQVRELVRAPFCTYLRSSIDLMRNFARSAGQDIDAEAFTAQDMEVLLSRAFERYFETSALFGTPDSCLRMIDRLKAIGVDEVACLIDFGVDHDAVLDSLQYLDLVRRRSNQPGRLRGDSYALPDQMRRHRVSHLQCTPSLASMLMLTPEMLAPLRSLRNLVLGGEALPASLAQQLAMGTSGAIHNMYGPTETTIWSTTHVVEKVDADIPIGQPIANTAAYILDRHLQPVPAGIPGELYIGGAGVAWGYLGRPDLTAARFTPNPFAVTKDEGRTTKDESEPSSFVVGLSSRLYRTGDLARARADGTLEFLGRLDQQVKISGHRIELGEIETTINQHPAVRESIVVAREDIPGDKRLIAYVVPNQPTAPVARQHVTEQETERHLAGHQRYRLPDGRVIAHHGVFQTSSLYREIFDHEIYLRHGITLNHGDCVFDVGANIGMFTLFVNERSTDARIYAFEPIPPTYELLRTNVALHGPNVQVFECGISNKNEQAIFTFYPQAAGLSGRFADMQKDKNIQRAILLDWLRRTRPDQVFAQDVDSIDQLLEEQLRSETYLCRLRTLSDVLSECQVERIDLLKIDVEGSELNVLGGIREEDWNKIKQIVIEVHTRELLDQITALLERRGYDLAVDELTAIEATAAEDSIYVALLYAVERDTQFAAARRPAEPRLSIAALRNFLQQKLPNFMVPAAFVLLDALPLTPNGKLDRRALPAPESARQVVEVAYVAPQTAVERRIAAIWQEVLRVQTVGIHDNFFEIGGNSLRLLQVRSKLHELVNANVPVTALFRHPTISALAGYLSQEQDDQPVVQQISDRSQKQATAIRRSDSISRQKRFMQERRQKK